MCLITTQKVPFIADRDIVCYKAMRVFGGALEPMWQSFGYELGILYETDIVELKTHERRISFDKFDSESLRLDGIYGEDREKKMDNLGYVSYGPGFHSAQTPERFVENDPGDIYECIIPAGSEYYVNPSGLMVSNKIKIVKKWKS